jgi:hypothetical protein
MICRSQHKPRWTKTGEFGMNTLTIFWDGSTDPFNAEGLRPRDYYPLPKHSRKRLRWLRTTTLTVLATTFMGVISNSAQAQYQQLLIRAAPYITSYTANAYRGSLYSRPAVSQFNRQYVYPTIRQGGNWAFGNFQYQSTPMMMPRRR